MGWEPEINKIGSIPNCELDSITHKKSFTCFGIVSGRSGGNKYTWDTAENVSISKQLDNSTRSIIDRLCKLGKPSLRLTVKDRSGVTATRTTSFRCAGIAL